MAANWARRRLSKLTLLEWLVMLAIIAVVVALIVPAGKWAASGDIRFPVRVFVFDAAHGTPIANARVGIFWAGPWHPSKRLDEQPDQYDPRRRVREEFSGVTVTDGTVVINYEFRTGANYVRPTMYAHVNFAWVHVQADGYGGVVVPVRHDSLPTSTLREQKELIVPVGLMPVE